MRPLRSVNRHRSDSARLVSGSDLRAAASSSISYDAQTIGAVLAPPAAPHYPYCDGDWPHTVKTVQERKDLAEEIKQKMLHDNVAWFYKLSDVG